MGEGGGGIMPDILENSHISRGGGGGGGGGGIMPIFGKEY